MILSAGQIAVKIVADHRNHPTAVWTERELGMISAITDALVAARGDRQDRIELADSYIVLLKSALKELAALMDDVRAGEYAPDSFTTEPARAVLKAMDGLTDGADMLKRTDALNRLVERISECYGDLPRSVQKQYDEFRGRLADGKIESGRATGPRNSDG